MAAASHPIRRILWLLSAYYLLIVVVALPPLVTLFGAGTDGKWTIAGVGFGLTVDGEQRLLLIAALAGALGSFIHGATSLMDYLGNRSLASAWVPWYFARPPIGVVLALLFYFVFRGGLLANTGADVTAAVSPYGIAAISGMVGMFSKQATDKLAEVFDTLFRSRKDESRGDKLITARPAIERLEPPQLEVGTAARTLRIHGRNFVDGAIVLFEGGERVPSAVEPAVITVDLDEHDVALEGDHEIVVASPAPSTLRSEPARLKIVKPVPAGP